MVKFAAQATPTYAEQWFTYEETVARSAGVLFLTDAILGSVGATNFRLGLSDSNTPSANPYTDTIAHWSNGVVYLRTGASTFVALGNVADANTYRFAFITRGTGCYILVKGGAFSNWTLLYIHNSGNTATLYPTLIGYDAVVDFDNIAAPDTTYLPTPSFYDTFNRADGAPSSTETTGPDGQTVTARTYSGTGTIVSNQLGVVPVLGSELVTNGDFANWTGDDPDGWTVPAEDASNFITEVSGTARYVAASGGFQVSQTPLTADTWVRVSVDSTAHTTGTLGVTVGITTNVVEIGTPATYTSTWLTDSISFAFRRKTSCDVTIDNVTAKQLDLSTCVASVDDTVSEDIYAFADLTITDNTQAGLMLRLDDADNPQNYLHVYCNRVNTNLYVDSVASGVVTNISSTAFTYSAGATLMVHLNGTAHRVYYNDALIVAGTNTVSGNTATALFATDAATRFDNFGQFPVGTGDEYSQLDSY